MSNRKIVIHDRHRVSIHHVGIQGPPGAGGTGTNAATPIVVTTATAPVFAQGDSVYFGSDGIWRKARSDSLATFGVYMVAAVGPLSFTLATLGHRIGGFANLNVGKFYHTSATVAGAIEPLQGASVQLAGAAGPNQVGQAVSPTELAYLPVYSSAAASAGGALADLSFVQADLTAAGILTVTHGLGTNPSGVTVFDELGEIVTPDYWRSTSTNAIEVNVSSFVPIVGTWKVSITS